MDLSPPGNGGTCRRAYAKAMRFVMRSLRRRPIFTITAVLTIALAIGANTALFGVIYAVLIQPLPFRNPNELVQIWETDPRLGFDREAGRMGAPAGDIRIRRVGFRAGTDEELRSLHAVESEVA